MATANHVSHLAQSNLAPSGAVGALFLLSGPSVDCAGDCLDVLEVSALFSMSVGGQMLLRGRLAITRPCSDRLRLRVHPVLCQE